MEENITFIAKFLLLSPPFYIGETVPQESYVNECKISLQQYVTTGKYYYRLMGKKDILKDIRIYLLLF